MTGVDTAETCRGWRNILRISCASSWFFLYTIITKLCTAGSWKYTTVQFLVPMAARSKAWVCGRLPAEIVGSNPTGGHGCLPCNCCLLSGRGLCDGLITRPEESYRLWCVWVWYGNLVNELDLSPLGGCRDQIKKVLVSNLYRVQQFYFIVIHITL
jgi:hypothetical protein